MRVLTELIRLLWQLDSLLVTRVFQPLVILIYKYTGVGNYTISKQMLRIAEAMFFGHICLLILLPFIERSVMPVPFAVFGVMVSFVLLRVANFFRHVASGLEKQHLHIRAKGQMPDFLDVFGLPASIRIFLLGWFFLSAFMMLPKLTLMVLGIPVRGSVVFADLWYFGALLLALAGCYFLACEHPPPNARRQPTLAKGRFAWGI